MTLDQVDSLFTYWRSSPPVHEMVARYLGIKPEESTVTEAPAISNDERDLVERMRERMAARG